MTEFARLLHDAAGRPPRPLNMADIRHRAARPGLRRRVGLGIVGLGALVGLSAPAGVSLLPAGDRPAAVETIENDQDRHQPTPSTSLVGPHPSPDTTVTSGVPGAPTAGPVTPTSGVASTPRLTPDEDEPTTSSSDYPAAAACSVDTYGLADGQQRACRFTATTEGGWNYYEPPHVTSDPNAEVEVRVTEPGGASRTYHLSKNYGNGALGGSYTLEGCADGIIEPGDLVQVTITQGPEPSTGLRWELGAGAGTGWGCSDGGP